MGAKTTMLVCAEGNASEWLALRPILEREATMRLAAEFFPGVRLEPLPDRDLSDTYAPNDEITIGWNWPGVIEQPSRPTIRLSVANMRL